MKILFEFNMPEDKDDFTACSNGKDYYLVLWNLAQYLRNKLKYEIYSTEYTKALEDVQERLVELMNKQEVSLEDLS